MEKISVLCPTCMHCGKAAQLEVVKAEYEAWKAGALIQRAMPNLPEDDRGLLITGTHSACWDAMFAN